MTQSVAETDRAESPVPGIQDYGRLAEDYDQTRYQGATNLLKEQFRQEALVGLLPRRVGRALDLACGTGRGVRIVRNHARVVVGVDGTFEMLQVAKDKIQTDKKTTVLCQANAARLPFADATFDLVTCLNFLHLFADADRKLAFANEIARVLKPGGIAVVEFDNALHGLFLGGLRKCFGKDIGYDWPWEIRRCFPGDRFQITAAVGANIPFIWRVPAFRLVERAAGRFPLNYLANRLFIQARGK